MANAVPLWSHQIASGASSFKRIPIILSGKRVTGPVATAAAEGPASAPFDFPTASAVPPSFRDAIFSASILRGTERQSVRVFASWRTRDIRSTVVRDHNQTHRLAGTKAPSFLPDSSYRKKTILEPRAIPVSWILALFLGLTFMIPPKCSTRCSTQIASHGNNCE